jgi:predicted Rossmann fold flavoprotein
MLEKNEKLGKKLYITGKGRCNATNACDINEFLLNVPRNPRFLYAALKFLTPDAFRALLLDLGCPTVLERGNRVFPESGKASDVTRALASGLQGVDVRVNTAVRALALDGAQARGVVLETDETLACASVIVATGGLSYPLTGSTGDGFRFARETGHTVTPLLPSLVPLETADAWPKELQGLTLKNVTLSAQYKGREIFSELGEMLFTHFGMSGPLILSLSSHLAGLPLADVAVQIDLKPGLTRDMLDARLQREFAQNGRKRLAAVMPGLLPASMAALFPRLCGVNGETFCSQASAADRAAITAALKALPVTLSALRPLSEAVITRGGVDIKQVNPGTMMSRLVSGLYFAGEVLDVDAYTGGFNLQIAFSTGALAGASAAVRQ